MATLRFKALELVSQRKPCEVNLPSQVASDYFGENVFSLQAMRATLSSEFFKKLKRTIDAGEKVDRNLADAVAAAMRTWAMSKGATHYTHWFQPLTGATAEKHDSFFDLTSEGEAIESFRGSALVQQEPDASSFPSGGIRNTFEARGYSAWDPSSPAFLIENAGAKTLCIPTIFVSYTGEALDYKTPLLKSLNLLGNAALPVCQYFDKDVTKVNTTLGIEQEYFLVDKALYEARPDMIMTGRTLFGHSPAKGQQLEDHYFGSIPSRVHAFMVDFEKSALRLGIPVRTRHNEVAPNQFECAPTYEDANLAVDHNQLLMDIMARVAERHHFKVLLHEKPYKGVNGSGKHNNWALSTNTGINLLSPGKKPKENLQFLTFFINTVMAVHKHADLLRASIASASNDHRLGANEAPPAIMSVFVGQQLSAVLDELERTSKVPMEKGDNMYLKLGIDRIPEVLRDNTDRNRTSPFAFTGNKFEFRAVGSSANSSSSMTVLNTIVADQLIEFRNSVDELIEVKGMKKELAIIQVLREYVVASKAIRFEGNGYSKEWEEEAERRGLSNVKSTPLALDVFHRAEVKDLFSRNGIFTEVEVAARHEILLEDYIKKIQIESRIMGDLAVNHVIPTAVAYQNKLIQNIRGLKELGLEDEYTQTTLESIKKMSRHITTIQRSVDEMIEARKVANKIESARERAIMYREQVFSYFDKIRYSVDKLELMVDDEDWPLVKYRELMFRH
ncbi:glutamine synthetase III [Pontibacter sp. BT310]|uniref:Glutamine synthetase III n=1 Tax=Pontibacter populi TaxID=890055 RepID=A0ABS6XFU9_9BACT|nr:MULTISPECIES: glutamine synthetase III [Pontibacter]MBJ6120002.1 glutamine synthetase III [Pontibacter sp. BT310]MBR0572431.1 glutamine synthetase III [Microvirga sp. STS03]MBW3366855.1 glutamine synthetase III [Pontibacter populi]